MGKPKTNIFKQFAEGFKSTLGGAASAIQKALGKLGETLKPKKQKKPKKPKQEEEPGKVVEQLPEEEPELTPLEEAIRDLTNEGYQYVLNPKASYDTADESFKNSMKAAYDQFGSEIFNQLYHTDMEMYGFDNKIIDAAIVQTYEKYAGSDSLPEYGDILSEIEDIIWNATITMSKTSYQRR